jgi:hypothetical protein
VNVYELHVDGDCDSWTCPICAVECDTCGKHLDACTCPTEETE